MRVIILGVVICALLLMAAPAAPCPLSGPAGESSGTFRERVGSSKQEVGRTGGGQVRKQEPGVEQKSKDDGPIRSPQEPVGCDAVTGYLDFAVIDTLSMEGAYLIVVARLGTGEKLRSLNQHRLRVVEEYIKRREPGLRYVLAEGRRVEGLGRVEVYVGGRLLHTLPLRKNAKGFCLPGQY